MNDNIDIDKVCSYLAELLQSKYNTIDLDWEKFLTPFLYVFDDYYTRVNIEKEDTDKEVTKLIIPYANSDYITSLEKESYHYQTIKRGKLDGNSKKNIEISKPSEAYIEKYIFPYSQKSKVAFLSFPTKVEKVLYYLMSLFDTDTCKLDDLQTDAVQKYDVFRDELVEKLVKKFGNHHIDELELLIFSLPSIYIENFYFYYKKAQRETQKLEVVNVIYFIRHFIFNPTFLILLSLKPIRKKKLITYQHGGVYGQTVAGWSEKVEKSISTHFLTWGYKYDKVDIPFVSLRISKKFSFIFKKFRKRESSILLILPLFYRQEVIDAIVNSLKIISLSGINESLDIRFDPREKNQKKVYAILDSLKLSYSVNNDTRSLVDVAVEYQTVVFLTPHATGYLELLNVNYYPFMLFHANDFDLREESQMLYEKMKKHGVWIDYDNVETIDKMKMTSKQKKVVQEFKKRFLNTSFFSALRLNYLLLKCSLNMKNKDI